MEDRRRDAVRQELLYLQRSFGSRDGEIKSGQMHRKEMTTTTETMIQVTCSSGGRPQIVFRSFVRQRGGESRAAHGNDHLGIVLVTQARKAHIDEGHEEEKHGRHLPNERWNHSARNLHEHSERCQLASISSSGSVCP